MTVPKTKMWRLCGGCYCYVVRKPGSMINEIYFSSPDRKKTSDAVLKILKLNSKDYFDIWINNEDAFKVRVGRSGGVGVEIKHPELPNPEEWYKVSNWMLDENPENKLEELMKFLRYIPTKEGGEFEGEFTPVFSEALPKTVTFTHQNLPEYLDVLEEAERRLNVEVNKKTSKWIPGNRYDTLDMSYYYVQEIYSRIINRGKGGGTEKYAFSSTSIGDVLNSKSYLFLTKKPLENIWDNVIFSTFDVSKEFNYLDFIQKRPNAADCGKWTDNKNIIPDVKEWRLNLMQRTLDTCCISKETVGDYESRSYQNLNLFFEPLYLFLGENDEEDMKKIGEYVNPLIEPVWREVTRDIIAKSYVDKFKDPDFIAGNEDVDKIFSLILTTYIREIFFDKKKLYDEMFSSLEFDYKGIIKEELDKFNFKDLLSTWEKYIINYKLIPEKDYTVDFRPCYNSSGYYYGGTATKADINQISDVLVNDTVRTIVLDTIKWSLDNHRIGLNSFDIHPGNRKTDPVMYEISLDLLNILDRFRAEEKELTDSDKAAIMSSGFWSVFMIVPVDIKWDEHYS